MTELIQSPIFAFALTLAAYGVGMSCYQLARCSPLLLPLVVSSALVTGALYVLPLNYTSYFAGNQIVHQALGPATVALAVPLYKQLSRIKPIVLPGLISIATGATLATALALVIAWSLGADATLLKGIAPKTVTTAIATQIAQLTGGNPSLAAGMVATSGIAGAVGANTIFHLLNITDERIRGLTLGICAHGVGTARAFEISPIAGAFSGLALGLSGLFIAFFLPMFLRNWLG